MPTFASVDAIQSFQKTVKGNRLFTKEHKLLIAVSGGADSMALSHICRSLGYDIAIAHMNYQLRGEASNLDATLVERTAQEWNVPIHLKKVDCQHYASSHNMAIQEAARDLRYQFFEELMNEHGYDRLLTAHHARDNVETMIYTLSKGAAIKALRGIPLTRDQIVRPLLYTTADDIRRYVRTNEVTYREDRSNNDKRYRRNFIRHDIIPKLEEINPSLESTLAQTAILGASYEHLIHQFLAISITSFQTSKQLILEPYSTVSSRFAWLYEHIHPMGFNLSNVRDIWFAYDQDNATGKTFQIEQTRLIIDRHLLRIEHITEDDYTPILIDSLNFTHPRLQIENNVDLHKCLDNEGLIILSKEKTTFPLTIRRWKAGDRFRPSGMKGQSKKVKDYLTDQKISGTQKRNVEVLISGDEIIWVVGYRKAHGFKNDNVTTGYFTIEIKNSLDSN